MCQKKLLVRKYYSHQSSMSSSRIKSKQAYSGGGGEGPRLAALLVTFGSFSRNSTCDRLFSLGLGPLSGPLSLAERRCCCEFEIPTLNWIDLRRGSSAYEMRLLGARKDSDPLSLRSWTGSSESTETLGDDMMLNRVSIGGNKM